MKFPGRMFVPGKCTSSPFYTAISVLYAVKVMDGIVFEDERTSRHRCAYTSIDVVKLSTERK